MDDLPDHRVCLRQGGIWRLRWFDGPQPYEPLWRAMREYTARRTVGDPDELWCLEHQPVYTLGQAGQLQFLHDTGVIPVVRSDRGGQVTYHGPGQVVLYSLVDLRRNRLGIRDLVWHLEQVILDLLEEEGVTGERRVGAPGVYVRGAKVAALGLRVRQGCSYHGLSLNVDMDLAPYAGIDPCGLTGTPVTHTRSLGIVTGATLLGERLMEKLWYVLQSKGTGMA